VLKFLSGLSPTLRSQVCSQILGGDNIPMLAAFSPESCVFLLALMYPMNHLLISLPCTMDVTEVVVVVATLAEDMVHLARDTIFLVDD